MQSNITSVYIFLLCFCCLFTGYLEANQNKKSSVEDKKAIQYSEMMSKVRDNHDTIYSVCMNYLIKVPSNKEEDHKIFSVVKEYNHGYIEKLLLRDAKDADWSCTFGIWLLVLLTFVIVGIVAVIIFKLVSMFCWPSSFHFQSCIIKNDN